MSNEEKEKQGFKVTDRRGFTAEGDRREGAPPGPEATEAKGEARVGADPGRSAAATPPPPPKGAGKAPGMDFSSFILSLATTAMVHLGEMPDPEGEAQQNLEAARQMVDILAMLQEKTEGNRSPEESQLLEDVLYELRMKFLSKSKAIQL